MASEHTTHHDDCGCLSERFKAEVDALRAKLAETEDAVCALAVWGVPRREFWRDAAKSVALKLHENSGQIVSLMHERDVALAEAAASQARVRELREWGGGGSDCYEHAENGCAEWCDRCQKGAEARTRQRSALAAPADDSALREVCERVGLAVLADERVDYRGDDDAAPECVTHDAVGRLLGHVLGPGTPSAAGPAGEEG